MIGDDALTLRLCRPHWALEDPILDTIYITPQGGQHRGPDTLAPHRRRYLRDGTEWRITPTPPGIRGRHECRCQQCVFAGIASAYAELDAAVLL